jgi:hypothetical protein
MALIWPVLRCGLGGTALGFATLATFSFVGVPTIPTDAHGLPLRAARPSLADALLSTGDLPPGFARTPPPRAARGCAGLLTDPAAGWAGAVRRQHERDGARLWEVIATPAGDPLAELRAQLSACTDQMGVRQLRPPVAGGFAVGISSGSTTGYLAAARVGSTVVVLRYLGRTGPDTATASRPEAVGVTLRTAVDKLVTVTGGATG